MKLFEQWFPEEAGSICKFASQFSDAVRGAMSATIVCSVLFGWYAATMYVVAKSLDDETFALVLRLMSYFGFAFALIPAYFIWPQKDEKTEHIESPKLTGRDAIHTSARAAAGRIAAESRVRGILEREFPGFLPRR